MNNLIAFLKSHSITVIAAYDNKIIVEALYSKNGVAFSQDEEIDATMSAVRDWLGY